MARRLIPPDAGRWPSEAVKELTAELDRLILAFGAAHEEAATWRVRYQATLLDLEHARADRLAALHAADVATRERDELRRTLAACTCRQSGHDRGD